MISSCIWIRKGVAKTVPDKFELNSEEYEKFLAVAKEEIEAGREEISDARKSHPVDSVMDTDDDLKKYNLQDYDEEDSIETSDFIFGNIKGLLYHENNEQDPYITMENNNDSEDDDEVDLKILSTDLLLAAGKTEDNISHVEIYVYEESQDNLYVHHDFMLPSFPLCLEWVCPTSDSGNFLSVGTFEPEIEIWNLDIVDSMYPNFILGREAEGIKKKKSSKSGKTNIERHVDAIMCLSWNKAHNSILASGSADHTIKLWDLTSDGSKALRSFSSCNDKVQCLSWNSTNTTVLASASYDCTMNLFDSRTPSQISTWKLQNEPEALKWNPFDSNSLMVSDESGHVTFFDIRSTNPILNLSAHSKSTTCIDWNPFAPNYFLTASSDSTVKLWKLSTDGVPMCLASKDLEVGKVFSASFCIDSPYLIAAAGSRGSLEIWNLNDNSAFKNELEKLIVAPY